MLIEALETIPYSLPFREPYVTARGRLERRELILVRLHTSGGPVGLGEAAPLQLRGGASLTEIDRELRERCAPIVEGTKLSVASLGGAIAAIREAGVSPQALAGVDIALHDLLGRIEGEPVWRLIGGTAPEPVPCNASLTAGDPAEVAAQAERWGERGFTTFKLKVGVPDDLAAVAAVRATAGAGARIRVDANGVWEPQEAIETLDAMSAHGLELAEQPTAEIADLAWVRRGVRVAIAADESLVGADDADALTAAGACDLATVKLAKCGGIVAALEIAARLPIYLSSALDGPVGIAAAAHAFQALPAEPPAGGLAQGLATQELFSDGVAAAGATLEGARLAPGEEPGLGVEIDELALARHRLRAAH
jgi:L-alanine-DL-glutamate epimerase-like enolase superfamily enzyme